MCLPTSTHLDRPHGTEGLFTRAIICRTKRTLIVAGDNSFRVFCHARCICAGKLRLHMHTICSFGISTLQLGLGTQDRPCMMHACQGVATNKSTSPQGRPGVAYCICIDGFEKRTLPASPYSIVSTARPRVVRSAAAGAAPKEGVVRATAAVVRSKNCTGSPIVHVDSNLLLHHRCACCCAVSNHARVPFVDPNPRGPPSPSHATITVAIAACEHAASVTGEKGTPEQRSGKY